MPFESIYQFICTMPYSPPYPRYQRKGYVSAMADLMVAELDKFR